MTRGLLLHFCQSIWASDAAVFLG